VSVEAKELPHGETKVDTVWQRLLEQLRSTPGIQSASLSEWNLFEGTGQNKSLRIPGRAAEAYLPWYLPVSPRFLETMRIPLIAGRDLEWRDLQPESPSAVIVNQAFAHRYFPGESPLGKRFSRVDGATLVAQEIVGVAGDAKYTSIRETPPPTVYDAFQPAGRAALQIRTTMEAGSLARLLRDEFRRVHPAFHIADLTLQSTLIGNTLVRDRALALLSAFFSIVAVVLVAVGLYGVLSYGVTQRTREIGIRVALGAQPLRVVGLVLSEIGFVTALGVAGGLAGGIGASRFIAALVYDVKPTGIWSIAAPLTCLLIACSLSALAPALRAVRVEPTMALRDE
jgi:predicted permease